MKISNSPIQVTYYLALSISMTTDLHSVEHHLQDYITFWHLFKVEKKSSYIRKTSNVSILKLDAAYLFPHYKLRYVKIRRL